MSVHDTQHYPEIKRMLGIPEDEPIFIIRGQDKVAVDAIDFYVDLSEAPGNDPSFMDDLRKVKDEFSDWQVKNSDKVKQAD
jgi:hypothetical protein